MRDVTRWHSGENGVDTFLVCWNVFQNLYRVAEDERSEPPGRNGLEIRCAQNELVPQQAT